MKTKVMPAVSSKFAKVGDTITFEDRIHIKKGTELVEAVVTQVFENSVMVDVRHLKQYVYEYTVVNHNHYKIV